MKLRDVGNLTEDPGKDWAKFIRSQNSLTGFIENLGDWNGLVDDVVETIQKWKIGDFDDFKKCVALESKGIFTGEENARRFSCVMMPKLMFKSSYISHEFKVPWGLACLRLIECDPDFEYLKTRK